MAEGDTLDYLEGQVDGREELAEALAPVPAQRLLLDRHAAQAHRPPPELLLLGERIAPLVCIHRVRRRDEVALQWAANRFRLLVLASL